MIYEPAIQGAGGMRLYEEKGLLSLCREAGALLIADEVMTGFGRTGPLFASSKTLTPDLICLSKGLTGGSLPLGVTAVQEHIYEAFLSDKRSQAFLHGHSYTANPISCAAALASLSLFCEEDRARIEAQHRMFCSRCDRTHLKRIECLGTILVLELKGEAGYYSSLRETLLRHFLDRKILLRPLGNVIYLMPPYCITNEELGEIYGAITALFSS